MLHSEMSAIAAQRSPDLTPRILKAASSLGLLGGTALSAPRMLAALCNPGTTLPEVAALIGHEPGLAVRVLRVANSAFYGLSRSVTTLERALVVLGLDAVRGIAAAACLDRTVMRSPETAVVNRAGLVRHSLATGAAAESLARRGHRTLASEAFISGLLHNLGVPLQAMLDFEGVKSMVDALLVDEAQDIRLLETMGAVPAHEHCVAIIFDSWNLPASLMQAVSHHHAPLEASEPHRKRAALLHLGMHVAWRSGFHFPLEPAMPDPPLEVMALLRLTAEDVDAVTQDLPVRLGQLQQALADV